MTRFARAKGSKASNEKTPEDSTPWEVMKEQLLQTQKNNNDAKKREAAEKQRLENYEKFLTEQKVQKRKATWCEFPGAEKSKKKQKDSTQDGGNFNNKILKHNVEHGTKQSKQNRDGAVMGKNNINTVVEKKTKQKKVINRNFEPHSQILENNNSLQSTQAESKREKKQTTAIINTTLNNVSSISDTVNSQISEHNNSLQSTEVEPKKKKRSKNKKKQPIIAVNNDATNQILSNDSSASNTGTTTIKVDDEQKGFSNKQNKDNKSMKKKNNKNLINGEPVRRKPINDRSFQLIINGKEVELVRFEGYPIMKRDAERIGELKSSMIKKGIPKSEVQRTIKLERRRAEKALARLKREVCYNCRKGGHNLSDCPDLKSKIPGVDAAEGVCFKCGSTEHRQFECKVQRDKEFRFATCFICKEPGHIARQCPDNPKGLYPNGGSCKLCGDVTHLRKDCPTVKDKKEGSSIKLQTLDGTDNIEDIGQQIRTTMSGESTKKPKKIKF